MSNGQIRVEATYGHKVARHIGLSIKIEGSDGGFIPSSYSDAGATALVISMTCGGALVGYLLAHVLLAWIGGAF